jgi:ABC-type antimicrobial peptide transport system permease subunit
MAVAAALSRLIASMLFGIRPLDAVTFAAAPVAIAAIAVAAMWAPARRATRVDPMEALRQE